LSRIRAYPAVRLIDVDGNQIGVIHPDKALTVAREKGLDLVEVAPNSDPPVCRIMDYGKYKYEKNIREKARRQSQKTRTKEIKLRPATAEHDYQFKKQHARDFLLSGAKVILTVMFRGRQMAHPELGAKMLKRMVSELTDVGEALSQPKMNGPNMSVVLVPRSDKT
jgi:translation initiation factor IF-3